MTSDEIVDALQPFGSVYVFQTETTKNFSAKCTLLIGGRKSEVKVNGFKTMHDALADLYESVIMNLSEGDVE